MKLDLQKSKTEKLELKEKISQLQQSAAIGEQTQQALGAAKNTMEKIFNLINETTSRIDTCLGGSNSNSTNRILKGGLVVFEEQYLEVKFMASNKKDSDLVRYLLSILVGDELLAQTTKSELLKSNKKMLIKAIIGTFN